MRTEDIEYAVELNNMIYLVTKKPVIVSETYDGYQHSLGSMVELSMFLADKTIYNLFEENDKAGVYDIVIGYIYVRKNPPYANSRTSVVMDSYFELLKKGHEQESGFKLEERSLSDLGITEVVAAGMTLDKPMLDDFLASMPMSE